MFRNEEIPVMLDIESMTPGELIFGSRQIARPSHRANLDERERGKTPTGFVDDENDAGWAVDGSN